MTPSEAPKSPKILIEKRAAPTLFYKFYKFMGKFPIIFSALQRYRQQMGTHRQQMGTHRQQMGTKLLIDGQQIVLFLVAHVQDHANRC